MNRVVIIGAGQAGKIIANELLHKKNFQVLGFLDDKNELLKKKIMGLPVLGPVKYLPELSEKENLSEVIVAIPSVKGERLKPIIEVLHKVQLPYKVTPGYYNCQSNDIDIQYPLRNINITDLLGRHTVDLPLPYVFDYVKGKRVLISGAGGSIGSEIARFCAMFEPEQMVLLGRGEGSVFSIQQELSMRFPKTKIVPVIANCTNRESVFLHFRRFAPQIVFHAAAHKHVFLMEEDPREAFRNNVGGAINVFDAACDTGVQGLVALSTDKAVAPKSIMGISKRIMECLIQNDYINQPPDFSCVRFGNVLGSRGSVIEVFQKQIESGKAVTVTDPKARRYFMTIPEAAQLVLLTGSISKKGHIYILDMGQQISILKLAKELISLHGYEPDTDIPIVFTGLKPGEKLKEALLRTPNLKKTIHGKIWEEPPPKNIKGIKGVCRQILDRLDDLSEAEIVFQMKKMIRAHTSG